jgi:hypothetical protein
MVHLGCLDKVLKFHRKFCVPARLSTPWIFARRPKSKYRHKLANEEFLADWQQAMFFGCNLELSLKKINLNH